MFTAGWTRIALVAGVVAASGWLALTPAAASVTVNCNSAQLQPTLSAAAPGSTVHVKGTCVGNFTIDVDLTLDGAPTATLDGGGIGTTLTVTGAPKVTLEHLRITDGFAPLGGGISAPGSAVLHLSHIVVADNLAFSAASASSSNLFAEGGGVYAAGGSLTLTSSTIEHNRTLAAAYASADDSIAQGGGVWASGRLEVTHSTVVANEIHAEGGGDAAAEGAGIYAAGGELIVQDSTVDANDAGSDGASDFSLSEGGGLNYQAVHGSATVGNSHFDRNIVSGSNTGGVAGVGDSGGALFFGDRVSVANSTFDDDKALAVASGPSTRADLGPAGLSISATKSGQVVDSRVEASLVRGVSSHVVDGAGGAVSAFGVLTISRTRITGTTIAMDAPEKEWQGGALFDQSSTTGQFTLVLDHDTVAATSMRNKGATTSAEMDGGGVYSEASTTVAHSTIADNVANFGTASAAELCGGGLALYPGTSTVAPTNRISDSTITGNTLAAKVSGASGSTVYGGGVYDNGVALKVTEATVARNTVGAGGTATVAGGGLYATAKTPLLSATILADNSAPTAVDGRDCSGPVASGGYVLLGTKTGCTYTKKGSDKIGVGPQLGSLHANGGPTETLALQKTSPAVNAVPVSACTIKADQRGVHRPQGPKCDIGAYELKPPAKHRKKRTSRST